MIRPFIKWAGGKTRVLPDLLPHLPAADCLIEPFVGGASVFLNTDYRRYVLADALLDANRQHGIQCVISNSDTPATREIYRHFGLHEISVQRSAGASAITRAAAKEVIGVLGCGGHGCGVCPYCVPLWWGLDMAAPAQGEAEVF